MNKISILTVLIFIAFLSCKSQEVKKGSASAHAKSYAEISVKEGGKWVGKQYEGGVFKNVTSLKLPSEHTDHSYYIRYEGPGWESNKVGYRLYLDWRNAIDIFGKLTDELVLHQVGQDGFDSYHLMTDWGSDILKVGKGLGIGAIGRFDGKEVLHFNKVQSTEATVENTSKNSSVNIFYQGWETLNEVINLTSNLSIAPDERLTKHTFQASKAINGICTGIVKLNDLKLISKESANKKWAYIATYGNQSILNDNLGMAIFYQTNTVENVVNSPYDHLLIFKPTTKAVTYYFGGAWEREYEGLKTEAAFFAYLNQKLEILNNQDKL